MIFSFPSITLILIGLFLASTDVRADSITVIQSSPNIYPPGFTLYSNPACINKSVRICDRVIDVPNTRLGIIRNLHLPSPYVHQPFTVQCVLINDIPVYSIIEFSSVTCALQTCPAQKLSVCGASIPVSAGVEVGSSITTAIPPTALADPTVFQNLNVTAECVMNAEDKPVYQLSNPNRISCNLFPCQRSTVRLCDRNIPIEGGAQLGAALHLTMPSPFVSDPFTVQCLGSQANQPMYQVTDAAAVSCALAE